MSHVGQELLTLLEHLSSLPVFNGVRVAWSLVFCVVFCTSLFVCSFSFGHCIVCSLRIVIPFWLVFSATPSSPSSYLQTVLLHHSLSFYRFSFGHKPVSCFFNACTNDFYFPVYCILIGRENMQFFDLCLLTTFFECSNLLKLYQTLYYVRNEGTDAYNDLYWFWHDSCITTLRHIALVKGTHAHMFVIRYISFLFNF